MTVPPQSLCTRAQQFNASAFTQDNSSTSAGEQNTRSPSLPRAVSADGDLTDRLIERAKQNGMALHGTEVYFS
jgi:hypothetical protein